MWSWSKASPQPQTDAQSTPEPSSQTTAYTRDTKGIQSRVDESIAYFPDSMTCQQAFDLALTCSNPMGQLRNGYRHGAWGNCSVQWGDFWFCMRARMYSGEQKQEMIRNHYREKEKNILAGPNSQDVWEERPTKATQNEFFSGDITNVKGW